MEGVPMAVERRNLSTKPGSDASSTSPKVTFLPNNAHALRVLNVLHEIHMTLAAEAAAEARSKRPDRKRRTA